MEIFVWKAWQHGDILTLFHVHVRQTDYTKICKFCICTTTMEEIKNRLIVENFKIQYRRK